MKPRENTVKDFVSHVLCDQGSPRDHNCRTWGLQGLGTSFPSCNQSSVTQEKGDAASHPVFWAKTQPPGWNTGQVKMCFIFGFWLAQRRNMIQGQPIRLHSGFIYGKILGEIAQLQTYWFRILGNEVQECGFCKRSTGNSLTCPVGEFPDMPHTLKPVVNLI